MKTNDILEAADKIRNLQKELRIVGSEITNINCEHACEDDEVLIFRGYVGDGYINLEHLYSSTCILKSLLENPNYEGHCENDCEVLEGEGLKYNINTFDKDWVTVKIVEVEEPVAWEDYTQTATYLEAYAPKYLDKDYVEKQTEKLNLRKKELEEELKTIEQSLK